MLLLALWIAFAPIQFGGQAAYVIVNGNSMEPLYHRGDLVIIRAQPDYGIGDIVTYRHPEIGPVIHRIIDRDGDRYVFKGDHNDFIDPYRPARSELIGMSWIYLPSAGTVLSQLRKPQHMALLTGVGGLIVIAPLMKSNNPRGKRKRRANAVGQPKPAAPQVGRSYEGLFMALAVLAFASLALAAFAFTRPATREVSDEITYQQTGAFDYSAAAPDGLYDSNTIQTGEPLFPQLTSEVAFNFDYKLVSDQPADLRGTYRLMAEIGAANGWKRTIEIVPETAFRGGAFIAGGALDFAKVRELADRFEQQTGLLRQQYTLAIVPEVAIKGTLAGHPLQDEYAPRLEFRLDQTQMQLQKGGGGAQDPLKPSKPGLITYTHVEPNIIPLLFLKLEVPLARWSSVGGVALGLIGMLWLGLLMLRAGRPDEAARIRSKYGPLLIDVAGDAQPPASPIVEVAAIGDLARLAEKSGQLILHEVCGATHRYALHDGGITYRYQIAPAHSNPPAGPTPKSSTGEEPAQARWHAAFLDALREKGTIAEACRTVDIDMVEAYAERSRAPAFAQAWNEARAARRDSPSCEVDRL